MSARWPVGLLARGLAAAGLLAAVLSVAPGSAQPAGATDAGARPDAIWATCTEHLPEGAVRPKLEVTFPDRGLSGYEARLELAIEHGPGETVLPEGFRLQRGSDAARGIEQAGFVIPEPDGGSSPRIERPQGTGAAQTTLSLPFMPLPKEPGRHVMVLPPVPIAIARASGEVMTLCTAPQTITVEDPIANEPEPEVRGNPPPRAQREEWLLAKQLFFGGLGALLLAALLAWLFVRWSRRPKPAPPRPKVLPWIAAMAELDQIRSSTLLADGHRDEHYDRVNDCIRLYLGERYGFDGLESTMEEMRNLLLRVRPKPNRVDDILRYLEEADFIKFTEATPSDEDCTSALNEAVEIVRRTTPPPAKKPRRRAEQDEESQRAA